MTEREPDHELLAELLDNQGPTGDPTTDGDPILTRSDEQKLLDEANQVAPPTLAPLDISLDPLDSVDKRRATAAASFGAEAIEIVRRHPLPVLMLAAGLAYLLSRRRHFSG